MNYYGHVVGVRMQADMRRDLFMKYERLSFSYFDNHKTGDLITRISNDLFDVSELAHHGPEDLVISVLTIIGALIVGQAAVDARVVSPIAVIIVAFSGISSYTLPSQDLASAIRLGRFAMVISAALAGIFGVTALFMLGIWHLCTMESCGISYMHPFVDGDDTAWLRTLLRRPLWKERFRDKKIAGYDLRKQK